MNFNEFTALLINEFKTFSSPSVTLFETETDSEEIVNIYLDAFVEGSNPIFRERREMDCSTCKYFLRKVGSLVKIVDNKKVSFWNFKTGDPIYQKVVDALAVYVESKPIANLPYYNDKISLTEENKELLTGGNLLTWRHLYFPIPSNCYSVSGLPDADKGIARTNKEVLLRSLKEITIDSTDTVLDLISQDLLYRGREWKSNLETFHRYQRDFKKLKNKEDRDNFAWLASTQSGGAICRIKNHSMGTLLVNLSLGMDLNVAVSKYDAIMAPSNYRRSKALQTPAMVEAAKKELTAQGLLESLPRRFSTLSDIKVNDVLFADRSLQASSSQPDVFDILKSQSKPPKSLDFKGISEGSIDKFIEKVLPRLTSLEVYLEKRFQPNLVSLISPVNKDAEPLFKWGNNTSWTYAGSYTDALKERVVSAGGSVAGPLRFSLQWNEDGNNKDDLDAHAEEPSPGKTHIYYQNAKRKHSSSGMLDVDIMEPGEKTAIENIIWSDLDSMPAGNYKLFVKNYSSRGGKGGFRAQIECMGETYNFDYQENIKDEEVVQVAVVNLNKNRTFKVIPKLPVKPEGTSKLWSLETNRFHSVNLALLSPNYWEGAKWGNKHYLFMLEGCQNPDRPNGFFNEYLDESLRPHRKALESLSSLMRVPADEQGDQLSGLGFSSTMRESLVVKATGKVSSILRIKF